MAAYEITLDSPTRLFDGQPEQFISETEKTPTWYYHNLKWILGFYNQPTGQISFNSLSNNQSNVTNNISYDSRRKYPVHFMIRMMSYYLGMQPNLDYNHLTQNVTTTNIQAQWRKGHDVAKFVNFFKGIMMERVSNAEFSAIPMSKEAISKRLSMYNALMLKYDLKPYFKELSDLGVNINPEGNKDFDLPEDIEKWMDTNFKEFGAITATDLANGLWFSNDWPHKVLQAFMHCVITSNCAMEHYVLNGKTEQRILMPYQLIIDNRFDNDYGKDDHFIGVIEPLTPVQILSDSRFKELSKEQMKDIEKMSQNNEIAGKYNLLTNNITWWSNSTQNNNTVSCVTVYWRGLRDTGKKKAKSKIGKEYIDENKYGDSESYKIQDIYKATIIGNKYLVNYGLVDNTVESMVDKSKLVFPIIRFRPNTFLGESISEVAKIYEIQDDMDMLKYKIQQIIGREKGKVYIINDNLADTLPEEVLNNLASMGLHVKRASGEIDDVTDKQRSVELIDWTLDPNITALVNLFKEWEDRMGKLLSASDISRGQNTKYVGMGVLQGTISQNSLGISYLIDGFLDWVVMNMYYANNQAKNLYAENEKEVDMLLGDRGVQYLKFTKDMKFESFWIKLTLNNIMDAQQKERILKVAQADTQNGKLGTADYVKLEVENSSIKMQEYFEYKEKKNEKKLSEQQTQQQQFTQSMEEQNKRFEMMMAETKQMAEFMKTKYAADAAAISKGISDIMKRMESDMPPQQPQSAQQPQQSA